MHGVTAQNLEAECSKFAYFMSLVSSKVEVLIKTWALCGRHDRLRNSDSGCSTPKPASKFAIEVLPVIHQSQALAFSGGTTCGRSEHIWITLFLQIRADLLGVLRLNYC